MVRFVEEGRADLSLSERLVLQGFANGGTWKTIAGELYLSPHTVRCHVDRARLKLGARNTAHAVAIAWRAGIVV